MGTFAGIIAVVLLLAWLMLAGAGCSRNASEEPPAIAPPPVVLTEKMKSLDRAAVRAMLKRLADTPAPKMTVFGAECYKPAGPSDRVDYLCPKCGERTLYVRHRQGLPDDPVVWIVDKELPKCRREFQELHKLAQDAIEFDESQFCRKCSPKVTSPKMAIHVTYEGAKARDVENITANDLRLLREFFAGDLMHHGFQDEKTPLQKSLPRLQELLGVKLNEQ